jgi:hypothetical protein
MLPDRTFNRVFASESMTFNTMIDEVCVSLSCPVGSRPPLQFKLSTDQESVPWEALSSPEDWARAISRVRQTKARQRVKPRRSLNVMIRHSSNLVCHVVYPLRHRC